MPYIQPDHRVRFDVPIADVIKELTDGGAEAINVGELNYVMSSIIWGIFDKKPSYTLGNNLIGVLECVKQEFVRRRLNDYENTKIVENGDL
jgi:hypothetical protein